MKILKDLKNIKALIPNILSASRIFAPIVIPSFIFTGNLPGTIISASAFALTDFFDGKIARKFNCQTKLGAIIDSVADKFFSIGMLLQLIPSSPLLLLNASLEGVIASINSKSFGDGDKPKTIFQGKVKTALLSLTLILQSLAIVTNIPNLQIASNIFALATSILQVSNAVKYGMIAKEKREINEENIKKENEIKKELEEKELTKQKVKNIDNELTNQKYNDYNNIYTVNNKPKVLSKKRKA